MLKKIIFTLFLALGASSVLALDVEQKPVRYVGTGTTVSISTSAWTLVPASSSLTSQDRSGIKVSNPSTNNAAFAAILSTSSVTPGEATTVRPIEIGAGENPFIEAEKNIFLYLLSLHTSAENAHVQEVGQ